MKNYYEILGISAHARVQEVKTAHRRLAARYHPDKNSHPQAQALFLLVQEAYECLSHPDRRMEYDATRKTTTLKDPQASARELWENFITSTIRSHHDS